MSHLIYHAYEKTGADKARQFGYTQSVKVENTVYISGQGGWSRDDPNVWAKDQCEQVDWAFSNVEKALEEAGAKFEHVFKVVSYHKPLASDSLGRVVENFAKYMPNHKPLWTCVQVEMLGEKEMEIEIELEPCWLDKSAALQKTLETIAEAADNGASLIALGELWIPGYPSFLYGGSMNDVMRHSIEYHNNAIAVDGIEMEAIKNAARDNGIIGKSLRPMHRRYDQGY